MPIVKNLDILEQALSGFSLRPIVLMVHQLILECTKEAFGYSVIQTSTFSTHGLLPPGTLSAKTVFNFYGPAASEPWTRSAVSRAGASYGQWKSHYNDFVGNIIGGGANSLGQWFSSVAAFPLLFTDKSPHSTYYP